MQADATYMGFVVFWGARVGFCSWFAAVSWRGIRSSRDEGILWTRPLLGDALQIFLFGLLTETTVLITLLPLSIPTFQTKRAASRAEGALEKRAR